MFKSIDGISQLRYLHKLPVYLVLSLISALIIMYAGKWIISLFSGRKLKTSEGEIKRGA